MRWPAATAWITLILTIGIGSAIETLSKNPLTIKLEMDPVAKDMLAYAKSQRVVIVNETLLDGCSLNVTGCATTIVMFAGHTMSPSQFFTNSSVNIRSGTVIIEGFKGQIKKTLATGESMKPFMGNVTLLYRGGKPNIGDLVIFNATTSGEDKYVVHQVIDVQNGTYTTKGFNNPSKDKYNTSLTSVAGIVVGVLY